MVPKCFVLLQYVYFRWSASTAVIEVLLRLLKCFCLIEVLVLLPQYSCVSAASVALLLLKKNFYCC